MNKTVAYSYKLKFNKQQVEKAFQWMGVCRLIYNMSLSICQESRRKLGKNIYRKELQKQLTQLRKEFDWVAAIQSQVAQSPLVRLERAFKNTASGGGTGR